MTIIRFVFIVAILVGLTNFAAILLNVSVLKAGKGDLSMSNQQSDSSDSGKKIFNKYCWVCHGQGGKGDGPASITLAEKPANFKSETIRNKTDENLYSSISDGYKTMTPYKDNLTPEQIKDVIAYIHQLQDEE